MEVEKQPKIVGYMAGLYAKMAQEANELTAGDGESTLVWQGRLIQTCNNVGIPTGYYKKVVDALRGIDSIEIVSRGNRGSSLTMIILKHPPTPELYREAIVKGGWEGLTTTPSIDRVAAEVKDILQTLGGINIVEILANIEERVRKLETAVSLLVKHDKQQQ